MALYPIIHKEWSEKMRNIFILMAFILISTIFLGACSSKDVNEATESNQNQTNVKQHDKDNKDTNENTNDSVEANSTESPEDTQKDKQSTSNEETHTDNAETDQHQNETSQNQSSTEENNQDNQIQTDTEEADQNKAVSLVKDYLKDEDNLIEDDDHFLQYDGEKNDYIIVRYSTMTSGHSSTNGRYAVDIDQEEVVDITSDPGFLEN